MDGCLNSSTSQTSEESWETGSNAKKRKRVGKINRGRCTKSKKSKVSSDAPAAETTQSKVTCVSGKQKIFTKKASKFKKKLHSCATWTNSLLRKG
ncbi:hypothetical protein GDO81_002927 [Engystomops pustulosus]|uniref:Uncharacterized protein n=1 Tax=Engystomops pustulosus TaxID=76066 RepID=A0AAV7DPW1_ENGPU|nr:hypothetical protein GDO81_002927 [Engystomops pustulosus]